MKRSAASAAIVLVALPCLVSCSSPGEGAEQHLLDQLPQSGASADISAGDLAPDPSWTRLAVVCPYEPTDALAERLEVDPGGLPDLSRADAKQALVAVGRNGETRAWVLDRDRVDLCANGDWPTIHSGGGIAKIAFTFDSGREVWLASPGSTT